MLRKDLMEKKALTVYKAYYLNTSGDKLVVDSQRDSFFTTQKAAVEDLLRSKIDFSDQEHPLKNCDELLGKEIDIIKMMIYMSNIPEADFKDQIVQEGDRITMGVEKYHRNLSIIPVILESFESAPRKNDPTQLDFPAINLSRLPSGS